MKYSEEGILTIFDDAEARKIFEAGSKLFGADPLLDRYQFPMGYLLYPRIEAVPPIEYPRKVSPVISRMAFLGMEEEIRETRSKELSEDEMPAAAYIALGIDNSMAPIQAVEYTPPTIPIPAELQVVKEAA